MKNTDVMKSLRGPKGSVVNLKVKRGPEFIDFAVTRDDIPIYSVDETFMADPTTGYIRITRFAESTARGGEGCNSQASQKRHEESYTRCER